MKMKLFAMLCVVAVLGLVAVQPAQAATKHLLELTADNVNINLADSWYETGTSGSGGTHWYNADLNLGRTGWLDTNYTDAAGKPNTDDGSTWNIKTGHLNLINGASLSLTSWGQLVIVNGGGDENAATVTLNPGAYFEQTYTDDTQGLFIAHGDGSAGTFIVNNGGQVGAATDVALGTWGTGATDGNTKTGVGVFKVIGDGGTIGADNFSISRYSKAVFELDDTGISTIQAGGELKIWDDADTGSPAGILSVDTSAYKGQHTVDLFTYGSLVGTFGTVQILGSELTSGNGTDPYTYNLTYGDGSNDKISLTYNNPATLYSSASAGWEIATTWDPVQVPTSANPVVVDGGDTVTVTGAGNAGKSLSITASSTVEVDGTLTIGEGVAVESGSTLDVDGTLTVTDTEEGVDIAGILTGGGLVEANVEMGGWMQPGDSIGTLDIDGNLALGSLSRYDWEVGTGFTADLVEVDGTLTLDDGWILKIINDGGDGATGDYKLFTYTTSLAGFDPDEVQYNLDDIGGLGWTTDMLSVYDDLGGNVYLHVVPHVVPEPSACIIWALGLLGLVWYGRRRRR